MKKNLKKLIWFAIILTVLAYVLYPKLKDIKGKNKDKTATGRKQSAVVRVTVVKPGLLREVIKSSGSIMSDEEVDLTFEASGKIESITLIEGKLVKKGQLLAKLNDDDLQAQLNKLVILRKLSLEKASRQKILLEKEAISQESYDQSSTDLQSLDADIKLLKVRIDETEIHAPFDGTIGLRYVSEGAYVTPSTRIAKLVKTSPVKIDFTIPERYGDLIKPGSEITFKVEGDINLNIAKVYAYEPKIDPVTRTIAVRATHDNKNGNIMPGRFASVELVIRENKNALQIPAESIMPDLGGERVYIVKDKKAIPVNVITGLRSESLIEIVNGLSPGDSVVTSGILQLRPDMPVIIDKGMGNEKTERPNSKSPKPNKKR
jgi:membrane fusion protein, multidrug efflux system